MFYRNTWSKESITPKLHMPEEHAIEFLSKWGGGFGLYGKQGAERLHATFNALHRTYCRMKTNSRRLANMMKEHLMRVHPEAQNLRPTVVSRKRKQSE